MTSERDSHGRTPTLNFNVQDEDDDPCEGLTEEECRDIENAVSISVIMASLECDENDVGEVVSALVDLLDGDIDVIDHICSSGSRIRITANADGTLNVETDPPIEELEDEGGGPPWR